MIRKSTIANIIFFLALCYYIWPWFFEKKLLFNELLSCIGLFLLLYKRFRIGMDVISICIMGLLLWGALHSIISIVRMDGIYYYLRNLVVLYSILAYFIGYYCFKYLGAFIRKARSFLNAISLLILIPLPRLLLERFNMSLIFPALFRNASSRWTPLLLIVINLVYGFVYNSFTTLVLSAFYMLLFVCPGYKFFKQVTLLGLFAFALVFVYLQPNLSLISVDYSPYSYNGIYNVINSHPILALDGNSTWRLVLWKQIIVDNFPTNIFGAGFGTPLLKYYPVEDFSKLSSLPYILGAHNSFVYLFGRLGIVYVIIAIIYYRKIFKEYFYHKAYYYSNNQILLFWSFIATSTIALFNPALESPIFASGYWLMLGLVARAIRNRQQIQSAQSPNHEDPVYS